MADLKTTFAGLTLKNPVIISSSGLTNSAAKNAKLEAAGAGAIVLKSLFEEQIMMEADRLRNHHTIRKEVIIWLNISVIINWQNIWN